MNFRTIDRSALEQKIAAHEINNRDASDGVALVNVLRPEAFDRRHIPDSINIPLEEIDRFERQFNKDKRIVVYCASAECNASPRAAGALAERGFTQVFDYEGGMADWESSQRPVAGREAVPSRVPS